MRTTVNCNNLQCILLLQVQESVGGNFETLQSNLVDLDSRVKALQK